MAVEFIPIVHTNQLPRPGQLCYAEADGLPIAIANLNGEYVAFSDSCRHEGGSLSSGILIDGVVTCPWHGWAYNVRTGKSVIPPIGLRIAVYPLRIEGEQVLVGISWD